MAKTAQFKELTFKNGEEFSQWLDRMTTKVINLKDMGQDMLTVYVHQSGEIIHTDYHNRIYSGKFVDVAVSGWPLTIDGEVYSRLVVESIEQK